MKQSGIAVAIFVLLAVTAAVPASADTNPKSDLRESSSLSVPAFFNDIFLLSMEANTTVKE